MRHWSQLGIRNWWVKPGRTLGVTAAIALGVAVVVWVPCAYESVRLAISGQVDFWVGRSDLAVESMLGPIGTVDAALADQVRELPNVAHVASRLRHEVMLHRIAPQEADPRVGDARPEADAPPPQDASADDGREPAPDPIISPGERVELVGIDPTIEYIFRDFELVSSRSRLLQPGDLNAVMIERRLADELGLGLGDRIVLRNVRSRGLFGSSEHRDTFTLVGIIEHRRVAKQQLPLIVATFDAVERLAPASETRPQVTRIDIKLEDNSPGALARTENQVRGLVDRARRGFLVTSAEARRKQVEAANEQTTFVLMMLSSIALFTAFFIILSTLSMGMVERIGQLGMLRCVGATRSQLAFLVLSEAMPLGVLGIGLGIPLGFGLTYLSILLAPEYIGHFEISTLGLMLGVAGGLLTTLAGAALPMLQAMRVSPMAAVRPQSRPPWGMMVWIAGGLGAAMIAGHSVMLERMPAPYWFRPSIAVSGVSLLYVGYALMTPAAIVLLSWFAVAAVARLMAVRRKLLAEQVGRAAWRSATICCGLMVGLSLIVSLFVHSASLTAGWNFPRDFYEAFVFISPSIDRAEADRIRRLPGVDQASSTVINESIRCQIFTGSDLFAFGSSRFVAGDPDDFFTRTRLEFVEGTREEATARLKEGGGVLVTPEFTRAKHVALGDRINIRPVEGARTAHSFEIVGVVTSPALDIAANYFNAGGLLASQSVFVALGTFEDARRVFRMRDQASMYLINFDLPEPETVPAAFRADAPPDLDDPLRAAAMFVDWLPAMPEREQEIDRIRRQIELRAGRDAVTYWEHLPPARQFRLALQRIAGEWDGLTPEQRWRMFREELVMRLLGDYSRSTGGYHASVGALKAQIDRDIERATALFASVPMVALIVAALGVGNLMMANIASRSRQIAVLRAVGTTRSQVIRLVIGEALVLGVLGSLLGLALGYHAAYGMNTMTEAIWGFRPQWTVPWKWIGTGIAFTIGICLIAGILPARQAARNNIISALQTT